MHTVPLSVLAARWGARRQHVHEGRCVVSKAPVRADHGEQHVGAELRLVGRRRTPRSRTVVQIPQRYQRLQQGLVRHAGSAQCGKDRWGGVWAVRHTPDEGAKQQHAQSYTVSPCQEPPLQAARLTETAPGSHSPDSAASNSSMLARPTQHVTVLLCSSRRPSGC